MRGPGTRFVIRDARQLRSLASAARQEILDVLSQMGRASAAEIAVALGRPASALYYHLRALARCGLVLPAGSRVRGGRPEALFRTPGTELAIRYDLSSADHQRGMNAIVASMLRLGIRDYRRSLGGGRVVVSGPRRDLWAIRKSGWLAPDQVVRVNRLIAALGATFRPQRRGRLYGITVLLTPLERRRPTGGTRGGASKGRRS